jgi:hypothetical protein
MDWLIKIKSLLYQIYYLKLLYKVDQPPPFLEIPASLMEKILNKTNDVGTIISDSISSIRRNKKGFRSKLKDLLYHDNVSERVD